MKNLMRPTTTIPILLRSLSPTHLLGLRPKPTKSRFRKKNVGLKSFFVVVERVVIWIKESMCFLRKNDAYYEEMESSMEKMPGQCRSAFLSPSP